MKYLTTEELKKDQKNYADKFLSNLAGKNVRYGLALNLFKEWSKKQSWTKEMKILDLGAAGGFFTNQLYDEGYHNIYAMDVDEYIPIEPKSKLKEFKTADLNIDKLPWPDSQFDLVTAWCILPHLENPFHCAREVSRILKPGSIFMFSALHLTSKASIDYLLKYGYFGSYRETNNHISLLPTSVVKKTIGKDFDLIDTDYLIIPKIFRGWRGKIRQQILKFSKKYPGLEKRLKERWGYNIVYVLKKK